jgi:hypothetical protein
MRRFIEILQDSAHRKVVRVGDTVRRPLHPWTPAVHALLRHLEALEFPYSPRVLGIDGEGGEILTFLDGESGSRVTAGRPPRMSRAICGIVIARR